MEPQKQRTIVRCFVGAFLLHLVQSGRPLCDLGGIQDHAGAIWATSLPFEMRGYRVGAFSVFFQFEIFGGKGEGLLLDIPRPSGPEDRSRMCHAIRLQRDQQPKTSPVRAAVLGG